jgi:NAD(P)H-hydrate epimerase
MREADRRTIAAGTSEALLMERAGARVFEFIERMFQPLSAQRVVVFCGRGNNGGDGMVVARMLDGKVGSLQVVASTDPMDGILDYKATLVVDALLGTGFHGPLTGRYAELVRKINEEFPKAKVVAVDVPSAMKVRADYTVTFASPKAEMLLSPEAQNIGQMIVADIGIPPEYLDTNLALSEAKDFKRLFQPRAADSHKGNYGHVVVVGGAAGKTGAASMTGQAALRMGAGLVTVACDNDSRLIPELMWQPLGDPDFVSALALPPKMSALAIGPGLGVRPDFVRSIVDHVQVPTVIDADGLNSLAGSDFRGRGLQTIMTPHPGEMRRLSADIKLDHEDANGGSADLLERVELARTFAQERNVCLVLKGYKTLIALPDSNVFVNPTGSPALAKGGTGDVLTGLIAGLVAATATELPHYIATAVRAAVWLHGRAGELAGKDLTENCVLATDLFRYLPQAIREIQNA